MTGAAILSILFAQSLATSEPVRIEGDNPVAVAHWMCGTADVNVWLPTEPDDEYVQGVRAYWEAANRRSPPGLRIELDEFSGDNGERMGIYRQRTSTPGKMAQTRSCTVHFGHLAEAIMLRDIAAFAQAEPSEKLIGVFLDETTWEAALPEQPEWDFVHVSVFSDPAMLPSGEKKRHPFVGTQIKFIKIDLEL